MTALTAATLSQPNDVVSVTAALTLYMAKCHRLPSKTERTLDKLIDDVGKSTVLVRMLKLDDVRSEMGNDRWCGIVRTNLVEQLQ